MKHIKKYNESVEWNDKYKSDLWKSLKSSIKNLLESGEIKRK